MARSSHTKQHYLDRDQCVVEGSSSGLCWIRVWWETSSYQTWHEKMIHLISLCMPLTVLKGGGEILTEDIHGVISWFLGACSCPCILKTKQSPFPLFVHPSFSPCPRDVHLLKYLIQQNNLTYDCPQTHTFLLGRLKVTALTSFAQENKARTHSDFGCKSIGGSAEKKESRCMAPLWLRMQHFQRRNGRK